MSPTAKGICCPGCSSASTSVLESRAINNGSTKRRRKCNDCGTRFTTYEISHEAYTKAGLLSHNTPKQSRPQVLEPQASSIPTHIHVSRMNAVVRQLDNLRRQILDTLD